MLVALLIIVQVFLALWLRASPVASRPASARSRRTRSLATLGLSLILTSGALQAAAVLDHPGDVCQESCADDVSDRQCPPNCHTCACGVPFARAPEPVSCLEPPPLLRFQARNLSRDFHLPSPPLFEIYRPPMS